MLQEVVFSVCRTHKLAHSGLNGIVIARYKKYTHLLHVCVEQKVPTHVSRQKRCMRQVEFRKQCFIIQVGTEFIARVYKCQRAVLINTLSANNQKQKGTLSA
jgi:hypothetical protein